MLPNAFSYFFGIFFFFVFHHKICFYHFFISFIKFPQQKISQSEASIGGFQMPVEVYGNDEIYTAGNTFETYRQAKSYDKINLFFITDICSSNNTCQDILLKC